MHSITVNDLTPPDPEKRGFADLWYFLTHYKAWWMTPIAVILLLLALLAAFTDDPAVVPFIYRVE